MKISNESVTGINYSETNDTLTNMHLIAGKMQANMDDITNIINEIKSDECWQEEAKEYYLDKLAKLISNFSDVYDSMEKTVLYGKYCVNNYMTAEERIANGYTKQQKGDQLWH